MMLPLSPTRRKCPTTPQPGGGTAGVCSIDAQCPAQDAILTAMSHITPAVQIEQVRHGQTVTVNGRVIHNG